MDAKNKNKNKNYIYIYVIFFPSKNQKQGEQAATLIISLIWVYLNFLQA